MSDFLMALYDADRDAVVVRLQSGTEVAVMDLDEADGFADEVKAASRKESTGYERLLAQENGDDVEDEDDSPAGVLDAGTQKCSMCGQVRPYAVGEGLFLPGTACPHCGAVAAVEVENGHYMFALTDEGNIDIFDEHGNSVDAYRLTGGSVLEDEDWGVGAQTLGVTREAVQAALDARVRDEDGVVGPCVLTGAEGENPDDCTTHDHE